MNDGDVSKQIEQMVRFIRQEADEKANEISVSAEEEFNIEKLQLLEVEKKKIRQEYERKQKQVEVRKKIEYSMQLNASRIKVLQAQDDLVGAMREAASKDLLTVSHHEFQHQHNYEALLKALIVQGLLKLKEPSVLLRCRKEDLHMVESVLDLAKEEYAAKTNVHQPEIIVDNIYLPSAPSSNDPHALSCSGGVVLASRDGKIVFENTLDARLDVIFRGKLPERVDLPSDAIHALSERRQRRPSDGEAPSCALKQGRQGADWVIGWVAKQASFIRRYEDYCISYIVMFLCFLAMVVLSNVASIADYGNDGVTYSVPYASVASRIESLGYGQGPKSKIPVTWSNNNNVGKEKNTSTVDKKLTQDILWRSLLSTQLENESAALDACRMTYDEIKKGKDTQMFREVVQKINGRLGGNVGSFWHRGTLLKGASHVKY
ncbi:V-type proton ATPase subunit E-like protein [Tanacetum coccineum]